jgi:hypothetical protein
MNRELALKIVLALVGLLFLALVFPLTIVMRQEPALSMMLSLYVTLGVFLRVCRAPENGMLCGGFIRLREAVVP